MRELGTGLRRVDGNIMGTFELIFEAVLVYCLRRFRSEKSCVLVVLGDSIMCGGDVMLAEWLQFVVINCINIASDVIIGKYQYYPVKVISSPFSATEFLPQVHQEGIISAMHSRRWRSILRFGPLNYFIQILY